MIFRWVPGKMKQNNSCISHDWIVDRSSERVGMR